MTNTIRLIVKPARQVRTVVRGIGLPGPQGPAGPVGLQVEDLLAAPITHPLTPSVIWLDEGHLAVSRPAILAAGVWNDLGVFYDSTNWIMS